MPFQKYLSRSAGTVAFCILLVSCSTTPTPGGDEPLAPPTPFVSVSPTASPPARPSPRLDPLTTGFADLVRAIPAQVGIVVVAGERSRTFGSAVPGPAWSTIKAPLAIAAIRHGGVDGTDLTPTVEAAISNSDNASAEDLWASLGSAKSAARQVQAVLAETGDYDTIVQSGRVRAGFTPFGQTRWSLRDQARFAWRLPCLPDASPVVAAMRSITASQKWGLASLDQSASKGGWGPDTNGSYLVRQFGIVKGVRGTTGVALVAAPEDGTFASGVNAIEALATWVATHQAQLPQATCEK